MTLYRFCLLDQADRVRALETIECDDGEEAEYLAHEMLDSLGYNAVEVWEDGKEPRASIARKSASTDRERDEKAAAGATGSRPRHSFESASVVEPEGLPVRRPTGPA